MSHRHGSLCSHICTHGYIPAKASLVSLRAWSKSLALAIVFGANASGGPWLAGREDHPTGLAHYLRVLALFSLFGRHPTRRCALIPMCPAGLSDAMVFETIGFGVLPPGMGGRTLHIPATDHHGHHQKEVLPPSLRGLPVNHRLWRRHESRRPSERILNAVREDQCCTSVLGIAYVDDVLRRFFEVFLKPGSCANPLAVAVLQSTAMFAW